MRSLAGLRLLLLLGVWTARPAQAVTLRGRVLDGPSAQAAPAIRAVVLLEAEGAAAAAPVRTARLGEVWLSFVPKVQVVPPGSTLALSNQDDESHTVHAWQGRRTLFNLATVPKGHVQRARLDKPGVVTVTCDLHTEMRAYVLVSRDLAGVTDLAGRFEVKGVAPGRYRVRLWRPEGGRHDASTAPGQAVGTLEVQEGAAPLELRFPVAVGRGRP